MPLMKHPFLLQIPIFAHMKFLIIAAILFGIYRFSTMNNSIETKKTGSIKQEEDTGFTDYEEVD